MLPISQRSTIKIVVSTLLSTAVVSIVVYAASISGVISQPINLGDTMGAGWYQQVNDRIEQICPAGVCSTGSSPSGAVIAFNLVTCPAGWSPANGSAGTPDLRGEFVRGLDGGRGADPDSSRALGGSQADMFRSHTHPTSIAEGGVLVGNGTVSGYPPGAGAGGLINFSIGSAGGAETRPRNVALLYCVKN